MNYKKFKDIMNKYPYSFRFYDKVIEEMKKYELQFLADEYSGYHQVQLKTTFTPIWSTFCYEVMLFRPCNTPATFQRPMNKVLELNLEHFVRVFMNIFELYRDHPHIWRS